MKLISKSENSCEDQCKLLVWDVDTLTCVHTVQQPTGGDMWCLATAGGRVWGGVGAEVGVWGRE